MRPLPLLLLISLALGAGAQDFSADFEAGVLDDQWFWTGNDPVFAQGDNSVWSITKESKDDCVPPLEKPWGMPFLFHPIPYRPDLFYSVTASIRMEGLATDANVARIGLGWLDRAGGYGFYYDAHAESSDPGWKDVHMPPRLYEPGFPGSEFGVVLHLDPAASNARGYFDNINVKAVTSLTGIATDAQALRIGLSPNPVTDRLTLTIPPGIQVRAIALLDGQGRTVRALASPTGGTIQLDLSGVPAGVYLLQVAHADGQLMQRVVKR